MMRRIPVLFSSFPTRIKTDDHADNISIKDGSSMSRCVAVLEHFIAFVTVLYIHVYTMRVEICKVSAPMNDGAIKYNPISQTHLDGPFKEKFYLWSESRLTFRQLND